MIHGLKPLVGSDVYFTQAENVTHPVAAPTLFVARTFDLLVFAIDAAPLPILPQVQVTFVAVPLLAFPLASLAFPFKWYSPLVVPLPAQLYSHSAILSYGYEK